MRIKLAEALLRRKELGMKVMQLHQIKEKDLFETKARRIKVTESLDDITAEVPKLDAGQVTEEFDFYAASLRQIDATIQQANWTTEVEVPESSMLSYERVNK